LVVKMSRQLVCGTKAETKKCCEIAIQPLSALVGVVLQHVPCRLGGFQRSFFQFSNCSFWYLSVGVQGRTGVAAVEERVAAGLLPSCASCRYSSA
jgi:hypothetical protein